MKKVFPSKEVQAERAYRREMKDLQKTDVKWVYTDPRFELELWAKDIDEAIYALNDFGIKNVDRSKIKQVNVNIEHEEVR